MQKYLSAPLRDVGSGRRKFILNSAKIAGGLTLFSASQLRANRGAKAMTVQQVIDLILKEGGLTALPDTVDTIKSGNASQEVTGIVTTMFATVSVIQEAAKRNANFIIAHEPSYYNHRDDPQWVQNNQVLREKQQLLEKYKMAIWRFHDYCHSLKPDAISFGVARKAGWVNYYQTGQRVLKIPPMSLQQLAQHLKSTLGIDHLRVIGNLQQSCERIALLPGAWGGQRQVTTAEAEKPDVLVVGETPEWETAEYIRDANLLGKKIGLIVLGHSVSEEPGMEWVAEWLQPKLQGIKVSHVASQSPFVWI